MSNLCDSDDLCCEYCGCGFAELPFKTLEVYSGKTLEYCSEECCFEGIKVHERDRALTFIKKKIGQYQELLTHIKVLRQFLDSWDTPRSFCGAWLLFYMTLERRGTEKGLIQLHEAALNKSLQVFYELEQHQLFKECCPDFFSIVTKSFTEETTTKDKGFIKLFKADS
jgi:hypothetical protein